DELLGPERGWTYLFALSPNHAAARILASKPPRCPNGSSAPPLYGGLEQIVSTVAAAHIEGDLGAVQSYADPERLPSTRPRRETIRAGGIQPCGSGRSSGSVAPPTMSSLESPSSPMRTTRVCSSAGRGGRQGATNLRQAGCGPRAANGTGASGRSHEQATLHSRKRERLRTDDRS